MSIVINNGIAEITVKTSSSDIINYFSQLPEAVRALQVVKTLEVGSLVLSRVSNYNDCDYVNSKVNDILSHILVKFSSLESTLCKNLQEALDPIKIGSPLSIASKLLANQSEIAATKLTEILRNTQDNLSKELLKIQTCTQTLDKSLDPTNKLGYLSAVIKTIDSFDSNLTQQFSDTNTNSLVSKLQNTINQNFGNDGAALRSLESKLQLDRATPLGQLYFGLKEEITLLRDAFMVMQGEEAAAEYSTSKGFDFEAVVFGVLQEIAKTHSDLTEDISKVSEAVSGSKKGDFSYTLLDSGNRLVLDAKNYKKLSSLKNMLDYLREAMKERNAAIGILVAPDEESLQKQIGSWNCYEGDKIITTLDNLEISIKFCKYYCRLKTNNTQVINSSLIKEKLEILLRKVKELSNVKTKLSKLSTGVTASISEIQNSLDLLKDDFLNSLTDLDNMLVKS